MAALRDFVEACANHEGVNNLERFALKLATEEAITNIISYGIEPGSSGTIDISFERAPQTSIITIRDDGNHFAPEIPDDLDLAADWEERTVGGLGLYLINEMMNKVSYNRDGSRNVLTLELDSA